MSRKIAVVTGTRADYGLLYPLLREIKEAKDFELQLVVSCMHWISDFGQTHHLIEDDGFPIASKVDMLLGNDSATAIGKSVGLATINFADEFSRLKPDLIVVLGDRFEILAAAQAAYIARIPLAHIHGGEISLGALDEGFRHVISKLSHLHFVAAEQYRHRVIQMGESPDRVFNVGALGLDNIESSTLLDKTQWEQAVGFQLSNLNFLVTYHPATIDPQGTKRNVENLLQALDCFPGANILFTKSNADETGRLIGNIMEDYVSANAHRCKLVANLGMQLYLSGLQHIDVVIGNSSSGLIEAPYFNKPTVNIGPRQDGRLRASSVIDCRDRRGDIVVAIEQALSPDFQTSLQNIQSPYGKGDVAKKIMTTLRKHNFKNLFRKRFYDMPQNSEVINA